jgi:imidazolonepropionase
MSPAAELMLLEAAELAGLASGVRVERTLLGAHAVPEDGDRERQVEAVVTEMIPAVVSGKRAGAVDVFADSIAFSAEQMERIFTAARDHGLDVKAHVGQIADVGAAQVAAAFGALSLDHCEHIPDSAMAGIASARSVAVLVPGASLYLGDPNVPPVEAFRRHGIGMAIATDLNPGSSPLASLPTAAALALHRFGLTPTEALLGITSMAARALQLADGRGRIEVGGIGDLAIWNARDPLEIVYWINAPVCAGVVIGGRVQEYQAW